MNRVTSDVVELRIRRAAPGADESSYEACAVLSSRLPPGRRTSGARRPTVAAPSSYFDLVPYFERLCLRPSTPLASSVPRTMW